MSDLRVTGAVVDATVVDTHVSNFSVYPPVEFSSPNTRITRVSCRATVRDVGEY